MIHSVFHSGNNTRSDLILSTDQSFEILFVIVLNFQLNMEHFNTTTQYFNLSWNFLFRGLYAVIFISTAKHAYPSKVVLYFAFIFHTLKFFIFVFIPVLRGIFLLNILFLLLICGQLFFITLSRKFIKCSDCFKS